MLSGKLALVTGGGSGIGRAVCEKFARLGAMVMVVDVNEEAAEATRKLIDDVSYGSEKHGAFQCDVSQRASVQSLRESVFLHTRGHPPTILVNSAGITQDAWLHRMTEDQWDRVMDVNLKGTFLQTFTEAMVAKGAEGSLINISSILGKMGNLGQANYSASKGGVIALTKTLAKELARKKIRVNCVLPGFIETAMTDAVPDKIPLGRMGKPDEIANACVFLASDLSTYVTGASIEVTGGMAM